MYRIFNMCVARNQSTLTKLNLVSKGYVDGIGTLSMDIKGDIILHSYENNNVCYELANLMFSNLKISSRKSVSDIELNDIYKSINEMLKQGLPMAIKHQFENSLILSIRLEYNI